MNYIQNTEVITSINNYNGTLFLKSSLDGFKNTRTLSGRDTRTIIFEGDIALFPEELVCPDCGSKMHINDTLSTELKHVPIGCSSSSVKVFRKQFLCPSCRKTQSQRIHFKADGFRITRELFYFTRRLLEERTMTLKDIAGITGLGKNTVKEIDLERLKEKYTADGISLKKPAETARFPGIDEFKLHDGHKYATHIINLETGHVLWISHGKKKKVVFDFMDHVGHEWMDNVEAVACDMNSDFQEAFEEKYPHIQVVFDHFHIIKNFNEKVIGEVRKDEQQRLIREGDKAGAAALKRTRYNLMSSRETLRKKDMAARDSEASVKNSTLFPVNIPSKRSDNEERYDSLISQNRLFLTIDIIKEFLKEAYSCTDEIRNAEMITEIIRICDGTGNRHFQWFGRLLYNHFEGVAAHASYGISTGKLEGINNKIKTIRRMGYGYPDDEYFFLKIIDFSRK